MHEAIIVEHVESSNTTDRDLFFTLFDTYAYRYISNIGVQGFACIKVTTHGG